MDPDAMDAMFQTNVYGPARVSQAFLPLLERSVKKTIVNVSSPLGSFGNGGVDFTASYSISKAALNMLVSLFVPQSTRRCMLNARTWMWADIQAGEGEAGIDDSISRSWVAEDG